MGNNKIVSREQAIERGLVRYYTGEACQHGHVNERYTLSGSCVECARVAKLEHNKRVLEKREAIKASQS